MAGPPWFTVVIPTRDSAAWIGGLLDHYRDRSVTPILLIDSRSSDATRAIARDRGVPVVDMPNFSVTEAVVRMTRDIVATPWALMIHDDEIPSDGLFARLRGPEPPPAVQSVAIARRWAWFEPGSALRYGRSEQWQDRAGDPGADHHWRLFRKDQVTFVSLMHSDGFIVDRWARMPPDAYIVHFEWVVRSYRQRAAKLRRYDRMRRGYGAYFHGMYLPEDQPPGVIAYAEFGTTAFDRLAQLYFAARRPEPASAPPSEPRRCRRLWQWLKTGFGRLGDDRTLRERSTPKLSQEVHGVFGAQDQPSAARSPVRRSGPA